MGCTSPCFWVTVQTKIHLPIVDYCQLIALGDYTSVISSWNAKDLKQINLSLLDASSVFDIRLYEWIYLFWPTDNLCNSINTNRRSIGMKVQLNHCVPGTCIKSTSLSEFPTAYCNLVWRVWLHCQGLANAQLQGQAMQCEDCVHGWARNLFWKPDYTAEAWPSDVNAKMPLKSYDRWCI